MLGDLMTSTFDWIDSLSHKFVVASVKLLKLNMVDPLRTE